MTVLDNLVRIGHRPGRNTWITVTTRRPASADFSKDSVGGRDMKTLKRELLNDAKTRAAYDTLADDYATARELIARHGEVRGGLGGGEESVLAWPIAPSTDSIQKATRRVANRRHAFIPTAGVFLDAPALLNKRNLRIVNP